MAGAVRWPVPLAEFRLLAVPGSSGRRQQAQHPDHDRLRARQDYVPSALGGCGPPAPGSSIESESANASPDGSTVRCRASMTSWPVSERGPAGHVR